MSKFKEGDIVVYANYPITEFIYKVVSVRPGPKGKQWDWCNLEYLDGRAIGEISDSALIHASPKCIQRCLGYYQQKQMVINHIIKVLKSKINP